MGEFIPISEFETYGISKSGTVKDFRSGKILTLYPNHYNRGYLQINIVNPNGPQTKRVHRLVAEAFIPNPDNLPEVDHIDRCPTNNAVENLRWASRSENQINKLMPKKQNKYKNIWFEDLKTPKSPTASWIISIKNSKCVYRKRYAFHKYTQEQVYMIRNQIYDAHDIPVLD